MLYQLELIFNTTQRTTKTQNKKRIEKICKLLF